MLREGEREEGWKGGRKECVGGGREGGRKCGRATSLLLMIRYRQCFDSPRVRRGREEQRKGKEIGGGGGGGEYEKWVPGF